jgi:rubredoxin
MADYIRRDIVLQIINTVNDTGGFAGYADYCVLFDEIDTMPATEVQPVKHGRWVVDEHGYLRCDSCGEVCLRNDIGIYVKSWYCPECGADMRKKKDGDTD